MKKRNRTRDSKGCFAAGGEYTIDAEKGIVYGVDGTPVGCLASNGYFYARRGNDTRLVHRMVWESAHGPIPDGLTVNHVNGVKTDNRLANLELLTPGENVSHAHQIGLCDKRGEAHHHAKLTDEAVMFIRRRRSDFTLRELAEMFGVSVPTICEAAKGRRWKHLPME